MQIQVLRQGWLLGMWAAIGFTISAAALAQGPVVAPDQQDRASAIRLRAEAIVAVEQRLEAAGVGQGSPAFGVTLPSGMESAPLPAEQMNFYIVGNPTDDREKWPER